MNDFVVLGVVPGATAIFGFVVGGPSGGLLGLFLTVVVGTLLLYAEDDEAERIEELEAQVEDIRRELEGDR